MFPKPFVVAHAVSRAVMTVIVTVIVTSPSTATGPLVFRLRSAKLVFYGAATVRKIAATNFACVPAHLACGLGWRWR